MAAKVTIRDVARRAGVSHQTVSRVINNSKKVAAETRERVQQAIRELDFTPNPLARSLARGRSHMLGVLVQRMHMVHLATVEGAMRAAHESGYELLLYEFDATKPRDGAMADFLATHHLEGLYVLFSGSAGYTNSVLEEVRSTVPIVTTGVELRRENVFVIPADNERGSRVATEHLVRLGHGRIAHVTGPEGSTTTRLRRVGYEKALTEAGIPIDPRLIVQADWSAGAGYAACERLLDRGGTFTAIVAQNDHIAVGCLRALRRQGVKVPAEVAVIGFDNAAFVDLIDPPLTTVYYPGRELGGLCVRTLVAKLEGDCRSPAEIFPADFAALVPYLVVRDSCGSRDRSGPAKR